MDIELLPLLPFKRVGQKFSMAFYEPGTMSAKYYGLEVVGKEKLALPGDLKVSCWVLNFDYGTDGEGGESARFWISEATREVLKMKGISKNGIRYKVKIY
jgi:hypothetical protein